jgi:hypothetical protein
MLTFPDYKRAVKRYSCVVTLTGVAAFGLFDAVMWLIIQLFGPQFVTVRNHFDGRLSSGWQEVIFPLSFFALSSPPPLLLLILVIRRARRQPALRCPSCNGEIASESSRRHVLQSLHCPHCRQQIVEHFEVMSDSNAAPQGTIAFTKDAKQIQSELNGHLRFAAIAWGLALPLIYGILIWGELTGPSSNPSWLVVILSPLAMVALLIGMTWVCTIGKAERAQKRNEDLAKLK